MKPVKPLAANMIYKGPTEEIGDLHCIRERPGKIITQWRLDELELQWLAAGALIELNLYHEPIPPVSLSVVEPFCPECMVNMKLAQPSPRSDWLFQCPECERWAI